LAAAANDPVALVDVAVCLDQYAIYDRTHAGQMGLAAAATRTGKDKRSFAMVLFIYLGGHTRGHFRARFGARATGGGTSLHMLIVAKLCAGLGAALANLGADAAGAAVQVRSAQHKVGAGLTDLSTVKQQANVRGLGMLAAHLQAVGNRLKANGMTARTVLNAASH
jgi:hypothetical protein